MEIVIFVLIIILAILQLIVIFKISGINNTSIEKLLGEQKDKVVSFQSKLDLFPELVESKIADTIQKRFTTFADSITTKNQDLIEKFGDFKNDLTKSLLENSKQLTEDFGTFKDAFKKSVNEDFDKLTTTVENKLESINNKVQENLNEGFKKTTETFNNVIERLTKIDEAQKKIDSLSTNVVSLQDILTDKKSRGIFGEVQLNQILFSVFGEKNDKIFQTQYKLSNGNIVDAILFAPDPPGNIPIDSKFPLENYKKMIDRTLSEEERNQAQKLFKSDVKKQIDDIADKYIIPNETANQAVMFLPAEAVFAELYAYHDDLVNYSQRRKIWITSPTTFMAVLSTLQIVLNDIERRKFADIIQQELMKLSEDFRRYKIRWDKLSTHIDTVQKDVKEIHTTTSKITTSFDKIANVELDKEYTIEKQQNIKLLE